MNGPDDEVARRFRENETLGEDSSFWFRATRPLLVDGRPVGKMCCLTTGPTIDDQLPLGLFTYTNKDRLVFWPALSKERYMVLGDERLNILDHITLEFPSEKMHLTYYTDDGEKEHLSDAARAFHYPGTDLAMCFQILVKVEVLQSQETEVQRMVKSPPGHPPRLVEWLQDFAASITFTPSSLPDYTSCDYIQYAVLLDPQNITEGKLPLVNDIITRDAREQFVDGWESNVEFPVHFSRFRVGECTLLLATSCPPGQLHHPVAFQIARRRRKKKTPAD
jgi:hypothetical protein